MARVSRLRLGTRRSPLALAQSGLVARQLERAHPGLEVELVPIVTQGDRTTGDLAEFGGKGLFTEELERRLLAGEIELAVHSLKDLPVKLGDGLRIAAFPKRADPSDVLISHDGSSLEELAHGARVLTGSLRRKALCLQLRPDLSVEPLRGNVGTRIRKWRESGAAGVILAAAGLERLGLVGADLETRSLNPASFVPAPGQGTLALETAEGGPAAELCSAINDPATERAAAAERFVVAAFGGDCTLPLAAWARDDEHHGELTLSAFVSTPDGTSWARRQASGREPIGIATEVVEGLRQEGGEEILANCGQAGCDQLC